MSDRACSALLLVGLVVLVALAVAEAFMPGTFARLVHLVSVPR